MEGIIGMIKLYAVDQPPAHWRVCDGSQLPKSNYPELFARIGQRFGGEGDTFALPNLPKEAAGYFVIMVHSSAESEVQHRGMVSQIVLSASDDAPTGYLPCDGRSVSAVQYPVLSQVMGTRFGGDGKGNIALPNIPDNRGVRYVICVEGINPMPPEEDDDDI
ncbi:MAG: phage tail protein [Bacteroidota bacterium]